MVAPTIELLHMDCMDYMRSLPDKAFDLAIVDPPYGIKWATSGTNRNHWATLHGGGKGQKVRAWDIRPDKAYWSELSRVARHRIVFGAQYFFDLLGPCECFVIWDKRMRGMIFSDAELAWTSFGKGENIEAFSGVRIVTESPVSSVRDSRIHPTQKPVALYRWLLQNYAKPGQRILDTHLGSGSIAIACEIEGFDLVGMDIDADYYKAAMARFEAHKAQPRMEFGEERPAPVQMTIEPAA